MLCGWFEALTFGPSNSLRDAVKHIDKVLSDLSLNLRDGLVKRC